MAADDYFVFMMSLYAS
uniref:Uncharacterized protein n=1 Tax=Anguilla anguilla TaxID=7936 RepID=A0A0E9P6R4_ANGAN